MSLDCLMDNDYDHDKCSLHFLNYRNCLKFWVFLLAYFCHVIAAAKRTDVYNMCAYYYYKYMT